MTDSTRLFQVVIAALLLVSLGAPAWAYVDPTAAGTALQALYMVFASLMLSIVLLPKKVANLFSRLKANLSRRPSPNEKEPQ